MNIIKSVEQDTGRNNIDAKMSDCAVRQSVHSAYRYIPVLRPVHQQLHAGYEGK